MGFGTHRFTVRASEHLPGEVSALPLAPARCLPAAAFALPAECPLLVAPAERRRLACPAHPLRAPLRRALCCGRVRAPALARMMPRTRAHMRHGGPVGQSLQAGRRQGTGRTPAPCTLATTSLECWPTEAGRATPPAHCCLFWLHAVLLRERRARGAAAMRAHVMRAHDRVPSPPRRYPHGANGGSQAGGTHGTGGVRRQWQAAAGPAAGGDGKWRRARWQRAGGSAPRGSAPRHAAARACGVRFDASVLRRKACGCETIWPGIVL